MIKINKGREPKEWREFRKTEGATYQANAELRKALLKEQGFLCAYCMRRIPVKDFGNPEMSRIDHIKARAQDKKSQLVYANMVICCPGYLNEDAHCDKLKDKDEITFSPFNKQTQGSIKYSSKDGHIISTNKDWDTQFNVILNLNNNLLKINRSQTLAGVIVELNKREWTKPTITKVLEEWSSFNKEGKLKPYCGIVIWYLEKKLRQYDNKKK